MAKELKTLLLEIGTEEIPSGYVSDMLSELKMSFIEGMKGLRIAHGEAMTYSTPRRIVLYVSDVEEKQKNISEETIGPPEKIAFGSDGKPTQAAIGFAKSRSVPVEDLKFKDTERGKYIIAVKEIEGERTDKTLQKFLPELIQSLHFPRSMKWGSVDFRFVRPIHWIVALFGERVISFELAGLKSGKKTFGHRFLSSNSISIKEPSEYFARLSSLKCLVDSKDRAASIHRQFQVISKRLKITPVYSDALFSKVLNLVEYPFVVVGEINKKYMDLPAEVLENVLNEQLMFFVTQDRNGKLTEKFIAVSNIKPKNQRILKQGYERVVEARLADAYFFFQDDLKFSLEQRAEILKGIVFFGKMGTYYDKTQRLISVCGKLSGQLAPDKGEMASRAALLCKADLTTNMVREFPKLQGVIGRVYGLIQKEKEGVATAIYEHYLPRFSGDKLPETIAGLILSLADRMDNIVCGFAMGYQPTGTTDPYALRRHALGIINGILKAGVCLPLKDLVCMSMDMIKDRVSSSPDAIIDKIMGFLRDRVENIFTANGIQKEAVDAVLFDESLDPVDLRMRIDVLIKNINKPEFSSMVLAYKRIINILGKNFFEDINNAIFSDNEEKVLYSTLIDKAQTLEQSIKERRYQDAFDTLALFVNPVNNFFDRVLIMTEDINLRNNRLAILNKIKKAFMNLADLSKFSVRTLEDRG